MTKLKISDDEWRARLSAESYCILRQKGTERPGSSALNDENRNGTFVCGGCGETLFHSEAKFDSGCGWPSFSQTIRPDVVEEHDDRSHFMHRTEITCARCDGHLGHVFPDGPRPTGLRYCMNGAALQFQPDES